MAEDKAKNTDRGAVSQVRKHYYLDEYAVIAPSRSRRARPYKNDAPVSQKATSTHHIEDSPSILEIPNRFGSGWGVKVVANKYPAFRPNHPDAKGQQEVVLETPQPATSLHQLPVEEIEDVLEAYRHRAHELSGQYSYVSIFKNHGHPSGATLDHSHSQIIATDLTPPEVKKEREALTQYQHQHKTSPLCDVIRWELSERSRVVAHTKFTTTICPFASQFPLETWIIPNRQSHSITGLNDHELHSLADHLKGVVLALGGNDISYNYYLSEGIAKLNNHFFIRVTPRLTIQAGFEIDTGIYINPVSPEYAAKWYKKHIQTPDVG